MLSTAKTGAAVSGIMTRLSHAKKSKREREKNWLMKDLLGLRDRLSGTASALNKFICQVHGISGVENDPDRRHVANIAVRGSRRNQQEITGLEHEFSLVRA